MEFKQAMRVIKRICTLLDGCEKCELKLNCPFIIIPSELDYNEAESVIAKWAEEHPKVETLPEAEWTSGGYELVKEGHHE